MTRGRRGPRTDHRAVLVGSLLLLVACTANKSLSGAADATTDDTPTGQLHVAATAMLALRSFHVDMSEDVPSKPNLSGSGTVDFQAPNREAARVGTGQDASESITIGDTDYFSVPGSPGHFQMLPHRAGAPGVFEAISYIKAILVSAQHIRFDGHTYAFNVPGSANMRLGAATGEATISDGLLDTVVFRYSAVEGVGHVALTSTYRAFNSGITVEAPAADHILPNPIIEPCPSSSTPPDSSVVPTCPTPR